MDADLVMSLNFRSVTRAHRSGWHLVELGINDRSKHPVSHVGLIMWADANTGKYVANYKDGYLSRFAFEKAEDAAYFKLRWA